MGDIGLGLIKNTWESAKNWITPKKNISTPDDELKQQIFAGQKKGGEITPQPEAKAGNWLNPGKKISTPDEELYNDIFASSSGNAAETSWENGGYEIPPDIYTRIREELPDVETPKQVTAFANVASNWYDGVEKALEEKERADEAAHDFIMAQYESGELGDDQLPENTDRQKAANWNLFKAIAKDPAGNIAITPGVPVQARVAAAILYIPFFLEDVNESYERNSSPDEEGQSPGFFKASYETGKEMLDPIVAPVLQAVHEPREFAREIWDDPTKLWEKVFLPGAVLTGAAKGGKGFLEKLDVFEAKEAGKGIEAAEREVGRGEGVVEAGNTLDRLAKTTKESVNCLHTCLSLNIQLEEIKLNSSKRLSALQKKILMLFDSL